MKNARRLPRWTLALLALALLTTQVAMPAPWLDRLNLTSLAATTLTFSPAANSLGVGDDTWISIRLNDVVDLVGVDIRIAYDPSVIDILPTGDGALEQGTMPRPDFMQSNSDNGIGTISYVAIQIGGGASGSGNVARMHVLGVADGTTSLTFIHHELASGGTDYIAHSVGTGSIIVGAGEPSPTPTVTETPLPTDTPTLTATPTETGTPTQTYTPGPTPTPSNTPTITLTPTPSNTPTITPTPSPSPTAAVRTFTGYVYQGGIGDTSRPLQGVQVQLRGSWVASNPGDYVTYDSTDAQGYFSVTHTGSFPHYSLVELDKPGYESVGAQPAAGGTVPDSTNNWVEFQNVGAGTYGDTIFWDRSLVGETATPTATATDQGGPTPSPTSGGGTPGPTAVPYGTPQFLNQRAGKDTYLNERDPEQNYGGYGHLHVGNHAAGPIKTILLWFDMGDIPSGSQVSEAQMVLLGQDLDPDMELDVVALLRPWEELQATWREAADDTPWDQDGALGVAVDHDATTLPGVFIDGGAAQYYQWDVLSLVQAWISGAQPNYGFLVLPALNTKAKETQGLYSSTYSLLGLRPQLRMVYTVATPTPTATPTNTPTRTPTVTPTPAGRVRLPLVRK